MSVSHSLPSTAPLEESLGSKKQIRLMQINYVRYPALYLHRLLSTQTDNDEARREKLLRLLAAEEAKSIPSSQHDVSLRSAITNPR